MIGFGVICGSTYFLLEVSIRIHAPPRWFSLQGLQSLASFSSAILMCALPRNEQPRDRPMLLHGNESRDQSAFKYC